MTHYGTLRQKSLNKVQFLYLHLTNQVEPIWDTSNFSAGSFFLPLLTLICTTITQSKAQTTHKLTLSEALQIATTNNKAIHKAKIGREIAEEEVVENKELRLPEVDFHASYARITDLTEYKHGLSDKVVTNTIPVMADVTGSLRTPIYTGGRIKNSILKAEQNHQLSEIQVEKTENDISIQTTILFLHIYKMMELDKLILENIKEEEDRLKEVKAFKVHGTVTKNEVLRAELQLSNMELSRLTNQRNMDVSLHDLHTLLELPEEEHIELDTTEIINRRIPDELPAKYSVAALQKDEMRISQKMEDILATDQKIVRSNYYPKLSFFASYAFNYPNYMFFPPNPYLYTLGKIGIEATYSLSNLYKNKSKMHLAHKKSEAQHTYTDEVRNQIQDQVFKQYSDLRNIKETIPVREKALLQAGENYRIVKLKYLNQLALITEMIDADNALLQAKFDMVSARIDALMKYHQLLHASGLNR